MHNSPLLLALMTLCSAQGQEVTYTHQADVIYARPDGTALTMDVFTPKGDANSAAVVWVISGGWYSTHEAIQVEYVKELLKRGYTVFAVVHRSQPRFTILDAMADVDRAVRFIRSEAKRFKIDPKRIGITGGSAGGHLALMQATTDDKADPTSEDPVLRQSGRVQAVACFYPPTDFLNYGQPGTNALGRGPLSFLKAPFAFKRYDRNMQMYVPVKDKMKILKIGRQISPINHVSSDDPPVLIIHGDADELVPIQQSKIFMEACEESDIDHKLVTREGKQHGWPNLVDDMTIVADWFDTHLLESKE